MKKSPTNVKFEKYVMSMIEKYIPILFLQRCVFELRKGTKNEKSAMECDSNYPYLNPIIYYSDLCIKEWKDGKDILGYIVHELCHVITEPLYVKAIGRYASKDEILDERERLTDFMCNIVLKNKLGEK